MFEYRLLWALGGVALGARDLNSPQKLVKLLDELPSFVRYGENLKPAVMISKLCIIEGNVAIGIAEKLLERATERRDLKLWLQQIPFSDLCKWFPTELGILLKELYK